MRRKLPGDGSLEAGDGGSFIAICPTSLSTVVNI
jgi:hypothetical protein